MARRFIDPDTGKQISRVEMVELFEQKEGRKFDTDEFSEYLRQVEHYEITGEWPND